MFRLDSLENSSIGGYRRGERAVKKNILIILLNWVTPDVIFYCRGMLVHVRMSATASASSPDRNPKSTL